VLADDTGASAKLVIHEERESLTIGHGAEPIGNAHHSVAIAGSVADGEDRGNLNAVRKRGYDIRLDGRAESSALAQRKPWPVEQQGASAYRGAL